MQNKTQNKCSQIPALPASPTCCVGEDATMDAIPNMLAWSLCQNQLVQQGHALIYEGLKQSIGIAATPGSSIAINFTFNF